MQSIYMINLVMHAFTEQNLALYKPKEWSKIGNTGEV